MKFKDPGDIDNFGDEIIFWIIISDVPVDIQNKAKQIDGEEYSPNCFGMCIAYDTDTKEFEVVEDEIEAGQSCNIYYINNDGDKTWFPAEVTPEFVQEIFEKCREEIEKGNIGL